MQLEEANQKQLEMWDHFVDNSINGTLFHKRSFLKYHGDKFQNKEKFIVILKGTEVIVQISLALLLDENGDIVAKSPYGASYGGFVFRHAPSYEESKEIILLFNQFLERNIVAKCYLTHPIACYDIMRLDTFYFSLLETGYISVDRNISSVMFLEEKPILEQVSPSVRRKVKNSTSGEKLKIIYDVELELAYSILEEEQRIKFGTKPTHTLEEFILLHQRFPQEISTIAIEYEGRIIAGITCFQLSSCIMTSFYIYMSSTYKNIEALRPLMTSALEIAQQKGITHFDFGTSSVNGVGKPSIFKFKEGFSKSGIFRETFMYRR